MGIRLVAVVTGLLTGLATVPAQAAKHDLHGMALGATADQVTTGAGMPCHTSPTGDVLCADPAEIGSSYKASMSGGAPSIAISIAHSFCTQREARRVLADEVGPFGVKVETARKDPNGYTVEIGADSEGVLNVEAGVCPGGAKQYEFSIRDNQLLRNSLKASSPAQK